jgi:hypothetical protein
MTIAIIGWIIMAVFWIMIISRQSSRYRSGNQQGNRPTIKRDHQVSHFEKHNKRKPSNRRKQFKDSGMINNDEYDVHDL